VRITGGEGAARGEGLEAKRGRDGLLAAVGWNLEDIDGEQSRSFLWA
jgi:hypothetical protein